MINQFIKLFTGAGIGTFASLINMQVVQSTQDVINFHVLLVNGILGIVVASFTLVFLYYQICKIKKDLKNKK